MGKRSQIEKAFQLHADKCHFISRVDYMTADSSSNFTEGRAVNVIRLNNLVIIMKCPLKRRKACMFFKCSLRLFNKFAQLFGHAIWVDFITLKNIKP